MNIEAHLFADVSDWRLSHQQGRVPDRVPYGLDRLPHHLTFAAPPDRSRRTRWALKATGLYAGGVGSRPAPGCELLLCWDEMFGVGQLLRSWRWGGPPVATGVIWLTDPDSLPPPGRLLARRLLPRAALVWVLSAAQVPALRRRWNVAEGRIGHLPFGVDTSFWTPGAVEQGASDGRPFVVGSVGNDRHRDHGSLVAALRLVREQLPGTRLELATWLPVPEGAGAVKRGVLSHVELRDTLYHRSDVVALATKPNLHVSGITTVLEAMACGRAVVATRTPGIEDYLEDGVTALLTTPGDVEGMARAITTLLCDGDQRRELAAAARSKVTAAFTTERMMAQLARLLADI